MSFTNQTQNKIMLIETVPRLINDQEYEDINGNAITFIPLKVITGKIPGTENYEISIPPYVIDSMRTDWFAKRNTVMSQKDIEKASEFLTLQALVEDIQRQKNMGITLKICPRLLALAQRYKQDLNKI